MTMPAAAVRTNCILIDLSSVAQPAVSLGINNAWSWGGFSWAQPVPAGSNLVLRLIKEPWGSRRTASSSSSNRSGAMSPAIGFAHMATRN